jgi:hypothetical protein
MHFTIRIRIQMLTRGCSVGYILIYVCPIRHIWMASHTRTKLYKVEAKSVSGKSTYRHSIFLEKAFVEDSLFPFKAGENLIARIEKDRLIITKAD